MKPGTRVLLVEDDRSIARLLQLELEHRGHIVQAVHDGLAALPAVKHFTPDVVILDILLPGMDGEQILARLRRSNRATPVLVLTARDRPSDKVRNLNEGADDYITKPFHIDELIARMSAILRRVTTDDILQFADLTINTDAHTVLRAERTIELTAREYALLVYFARNARHVLSREQILDAVWQDSLEAGTNVVDVYIGYLRKKIDQPTSPRLIQTVRGIGYVLRED